VTSAPLRHEPFIPPVAESGHARCREHTVLFARNAGCRPLDSVLGNLSVIFSIGIKRLPTANTTGNASGNPVS
jgi:hypothetical protein